MIDTIKLTLDKTMFTILDRSKFHQDMMNVSHGFYKLVQNPTKAELKAGIYKPCLTLTPRFNCSRRSETTLTIQLSLPKLLKGNNFDELVDSDFAKAVSRLEAKLIEMGIGVTTSVLEKAPASAVHYSKNIPLTKGLTPYFFIKRFNEANIKQSLDTEKTSYRNDGQMFKSHCNSYEIAIYDKLKDLQAAKISEKRAYEDCNALQLNLLDEIDRKKHFEVLRMEIRLNCRQKIRQVFKALGIENDLTFKSVFSSKISQTVLLYYLNEIKGERLPLLDLQGKGDIGFLSEIALSNPKIKPPRALELLGIKRAVSEAGPREVKKIFKNYSDRSWYRFFAEAKKIKLNGLKDPFETIRKSLLEFKPLKLVDFQDCLLKNDKYGK